MKYIIKCPYCDKTYTVNVSGKATDFICSSCGGANGMKDVVKQVATPQILSGRGKKDPVTDTDIDTIKSFSMEDHKVKISFPWGQIIGMLIIAIALAFLLTYAAGAGSVVVVVIGFFVAVPVICYKSAIAESAPNQYWQEKDEEAESFEDEMNPWYPEMFEEDE